MRLNNTAEVIGRDPRVHVGGRDHAASRTCVAEVVAVLLDADGFANQGRGIDERPVQDSLRKRADH